MARNKSREIIIVCIKSGKTKSAIAKSMGVHINTVNYTWKVYLERGTTDNAPNPSRPISKEHKDIKEAISSRVKADPNVSVRGLSREFGMARMTMRRLVKEDLGLKSLAKVKCQQLTAPQRLKRETMCKKMLNMMKREVKGKVLVFLDEKDFHLTKHHNCCNDHTLAPNTKSVSPANRFIGRAKFPKKAMFFRYVVSDRKAFPGIWLKGTLNGAKYKSILAKHVIPTLNSTYGAGNYIWTQGGISSHTANSILKYLDGKLGSQGVLVQGHLATKLLQPEPPGLQCVVLC